LYRFRDNIADFPRVKDVTSRGHVSDDSDHAPLRDNLSSICWDLLWSTRTPTLKSLA